MAIRAGALDVRPAVPNPPGMSRRTDDSAQRARLMRPHIQQVEALPHLIGSEQVPFLNELPHHLFRSFYPRRVSMCFDLLYRFLREQIALDGAHFCTTGWTSSRHDGLRSNATCEPFM